MSKEKTILNERIKDILYGLKQINEKGKYSDKNQKEIISSLEKILKKNKDKDIVKSIEDVKQFLNSAKLPEEFKVKVINQIDSVEIKKPSWYKQFSIPKGVFDPLIEFLGTTLNKVTSKIFDVRIDIDKRDPNDYINVRLTTGKEFYKSEGGGGSPMIGWGTPSNVATTDKQDDIISAIEGIDRETFEYMGDQTSGDFKYLGFKEKGSTNWKIMRKNNTDTSAWAYAYGTSGWTAAWADPTALSFADPPDS